MSPIIQAKLLPTALYRVLVLLPLLFPALVQGDSRLEPSPVATTGEQPLAATVLGEEVRTSDPDAMRSRVLGRLFDRYAEQQGIVVRAEEIEALADEMARSMRAAGLTAEQSVSDTEKIQAEHMRRDFASAIIRQWKLNKALYQRYGGRIVAQQLGPEPLDAYRSYLEERQSAGDFSIHDSALEQAFWRYFITDGLHVFLEPGSEEEAHAFSTPPWKRPEQRRIEAPRAPLGTR